jgi:hypothetical protein
LPSVSGGALICGGNKGLNYKLATSFKHNHLV